MKSSKNYMRKHKVIDMIYLSLNMIGVKNTVMRYARSMVDLEQQQENY